MLSEGTLDALSEALRLGMQRQLVDFDNHLDDVAQDYLNAQLNDKLD